MLLTTVNAVLQRVPPREMVRQTMLSAAPGNLLPMAGIIQWLDLNGFGRAATVREAGEYAVRGGIVDLFAPGMDEPVRLDFFGETPGIHPKFRSGDPAHHRRTARARPRADSRVSAHTDTIRHFRTGYVAAFGAAAPDDALYQAVTEGRRHRRHGALAAAVP